MPICTSECDTCTFRNSLDLIFTSPLPLLHRPIVKQYDMWDTFCVDQGKEWYLMLFVQEELAHLWRNTNRAPHLQTSNHCVERMWVEVNGRVNYHSRSV